PESAARLQKDFDRSRITLLPNRALFLARHPRLVEDSADDGAGKRAHGAICRQRLGSAAATDAHLDAGVGLLHCDDRRTVPHVDPLREFLRQPLVAVLDAVADAPALRVQTVKKKRRGRTEIRTEAEREELRRRRRRAERAQPGTRREAVPRTHRL